MTVGEARDDYFARNGFSAADYQARWVRVQLGILPIVFPNVASRRRAIRFHDLHHVLTGYDSSVLGEAQIGAWELAATAGHRGLTYYAAWVLNLAMFTVGLVLAPRRVYRAFVRGRGCRSLYELGWTDALLARQVEELRHRLGLDRPHRATWADRIAFAAWASVPFVGAAGALALVSLVV